MEDIPAQQVDVDDEEVQDSTISSNSILSIEAVYVKEEFDEEEPNNNIEVQFDETDHDIFNASTSNSINLQANIQMIHYPEPNIRINENLNFDDNALNLVKIRKVNSVVEKSEATSTSSLPENFQRTGNNQLMHFISAPLQNEETIPIEMLGINNAYEQNRFPAVDDCMQEIDRPSTSRQEVPLMRNERNSIDVESRDAEVEQVAGPSKQDDSETEIQPGTTDRQQYVCDNCQVRYSKRCCLITHIFNIHNEGPSCSAEKPCCCESGSYQCDQCQQKFPSKEKLEKHLQQHGGVSCNTSSKKNKIKAYLFEDLICSECGKKFREASQLENHKRSHNFVCDVCQKEFKRLSLLEEHKLTHKMIAFKCNVCESEFQTKDKLHLHQKVHETDKPFCCVKCNKQFSHNSQYLIHLRVHSGDKPYACEICNKRFGQKSILNRHLRIHKNEKPYQCDLCQKKFRQNNHLDNHKKKIHKEKKEHEERN